MGVSVSAATGILFIVMIISYGVILQAQDDKDRVVEEARRDYIERNRELLDTTVYIINSKYWEDPENYMTLNMSNNGSAIVDLRYTDVYLNGTHYNNTYTVISSSNDTIDNTTILAPREIAYITIDFSAEPIELPVRVKICCPNGVSIYTTLE